MASHSFTVFMRFMLPAVALIGILFFSLASTQAHATACGKPDYERDRDRGIYVWQNCGTGKWYFRVSSGGRPKNDEFRVEGRLKLDRPFPFLDAFSLDAGANGSQDLFKTPEPDTAEFVFRVWVDAQDGFDFRLTNNTNACLKINTPNDLPVVIGKKNIRVYPPVNLATLNSRDCGVVLPAPLLLL